MTVYHRKARVSVDGRMGTIDYCCESVAHVHFDDDPHHVALYHPDELTLVRP